MLGDTGDPRARTLALAVLRHRDPIDARLDAPPAV